MDPSTKRTARLAGLLYLVSSLPAPFALIYVPNKIFVEGDPAATAERLRTYADLVRAGIAASLASGLLFIFVPLVLFRLFKPTSEWPALAMLVLILLSFPISLFSRNVNQIAALHLAVADGAAGSAGALSRLSPRPSAMPSPTSRCRTSTTRSSWWPRSSGVSGCSRSASA